MSSAVGDVISSATVVGLGRSVTINIAVADALDAQVDVLALKFAQARYGVDLAVLKRLKKPEDAPDLPKPGQSLVLDTGGALGASTIVLVGTVPLEHFDYADIREFARLSIAAARTVSQRVVHLGMTLHGVGFGLDEEEAFTAQLAGLLDALRDQQWPRSLDTVSILELDEKRARRLGAVMAQVLPREPDEHLARRPGVSGDADRRRSSAIDSAGPGSRDKPHVFVAMQFGAETDDLYHYGIQAAVKANEFLCERIDATSFVGDILTQIKSKIDSASFVVADLSTANPNVYLEVGYAWGRNVKTMLLVRDPKELRFDVQGQRCVVYSSIRDLEEKLTRELRELSRGRATP